MTIRERILSVYRGETPDVVPYMLDLSHWFYHKNKLPWDLSRSYTEPEYRLIDYHKSAGAGFYAPNLAAFFSVEYPDDVQVEVKKREAGGAPEIAWKYHTPGGSIERVRRWNDTTYAWGIDDWGVKSREALRVLSYAMSRRTFIPHWDRYRAWTDYVGDTGVVYLVSGYSAMGMLLNYWMGVEGVMYAAADWPDLLHETVEAINLNNLDCVDLIARSPAEIVIMGDNFSSDIQPPHFFAEWSGAYYAEAIRRLHAAGKFVAVHIDGRLRKAITMIREAGADCADAVTPRPMGDLSPEECRAEAGRDFILSGGVSPDLWLPNTPLDKFRTTVTDWLETRKTSSRLIANAGDQVPPGADEGRIALMRDLVEQYGRY